MTPNSRTILASWHNRTSLIVIVIAVAFTILISCQNRQSAAVIPVPQTESWWIARHQEAVARIRQGDVSLVFIGDSITQGWMDDGRKVWDRYYGQRHAVNLGFNKDCTEHVLWRLTHGEIEGIAPKLIVLMIGTNNTGIRQDPAHSTAEGIQTILAILRRAVPESKILLLAIFPRGASADDPFRRLNAAINDRIKAYVDNQQIFFLDLGRRFLDAEGRLLRDLMPDDLHPNERGYQAWAEGMEKTVSMLFTENRSGHTVREPDNHIFSD